MNFTSRQWFDCCSKDKNKPDMNSKVHVERSKKIDRFLQKHKKSYFMKYNILLLGTGESGKSTFLKQLKIINGKKFTESEINTFKDTIYDNIFKGILFLIDARFQLKLKWSNENSIKSAQKIESHFEIFKKKRRDLPRGSLIWNEEDFLNLVSDLKLVWLDNCIQEAFSRRCEMLTEKFGENTRYFMNKIDQIAVKNYVPINDDIVWSRKPTDSIIEEEFQVNSNTNLVFIDVGGQTKERRKWCRLFSGLSTLLFFIASSQFDESYIDRYTGDMRNKLRESMFVFSELVNHEALIDSALILFFNKTDLLTEKLQESNRYTNIRSEFPEFPQNSNPYHFQHVQQFLVDSFVNLIIENTRMQGSAFNSLRVTRNSSTVTNSSIDKHKSTTVTSPPISPPNSPLKRTIYRHFTTAIDRKNIELVYHAMKDTLLQGYMRKIMMN